MIRLGDAALQVRGACTATRAWVWLYTLPLPAPIRVERREEIASDLWEHQDDASRTHEPGPSLSWAILRRCLLGLPADIAWSAETTWRARRSPRAHERGRYVMPAVRANTAFTGLAVLSFVWIALFTGLATTTGEGVSAWWGFLGVAALLVAAGLWLDRSRPILGQLLIVVPTVAMAIITAWSILSPILAVLLIVAWAGRYGFFRT